MYTRSYISFFLVFIFAFFVSDCVTSSSQSQRLNIERSLPQSRLAYYNDSFDKLREDIWEKGAFFFKPDQETGFKVGDINIEAGQLKIKTKPGSFSNVSLSTKYVFRGDFDIQLDCHFDFLEGVYDMDQLLLFGVYDSKLQWDESNSYVFLILKRGSEDSGRIFSAYRKGGKRHSRNAEKISNFHGTLRIVRIGNKIRTLYKKKEMNKWKRMDTFSFTKNDLSVTILLSNYGTVRNYITAKSSITAKFDNFRINAAQNIIEEDI